MRLKWSTKWLFAPGIAAGIGVVAVITLDQFYDVHYTFVGIGTIIVGITGFTSLWQKAEEAHRTATRVEKSVNGGMTSLAQQILHDEIRVAGLEVGLGSRVMALEQSKQDCVEEKRICLEENEKLRNWVIAKLGESGKGREEGREES